MAKTKPKWTALTAKWESLQFGGEGPVTVGEANGQATIKLELGDPLTGVRWTGEVPNANYELRLQARRVEGIDFFCGLTFPIDDSAMTLVLGGWGGGITGLSSIDGLDASENSTTLYRHYDNETWFDVRVRISPYGVEAWVAEESAKEQDRVVDLMREDQQYDLRFEMELCKPLGLANYQCVSEFRNIQWRKLSGEEIAAAEAQLKEWTEE